MTPTTSLEPASVAGATLRLAARRSQLATAQARWVGQQLAAATGRPLELVGITTRGDVDTAPLSRIGGQGVFVAAVREALRAAGAEVAVHSLKDLPTAPAQGLTLAAVPEREDPRDALVAGAGWTLDTLPRGARVGTGSPRRRAQLLAVRPDLQIVDLRGNVDTRLARVLGGRPDGSEPDLAAVVLAVAGLARLGRIDVITERLDPLVVTPAPGQGALAVETPTRVTADLADALARLEDAPTRAAVSAERALLATLGAGCTAPVGAWAHVDPAPGRPTLTLHAVLADDSGRLVRGTRTGPPDRATDLGAALAAELMTEAADPARQTRGEPQPPAPRESP